MRLGESPVFPCLQTFSKWVLLRIKITGYEMEVTTNELKAMVDTSVLAKALGISSRRVQQLTRDGTITAYTLIGTHHRYDLLASIREYITYQNERAAEGEDKRQLAADKMRADIAYITSQAQYTRLKVRRLKDECITMAQARADLLEFKPAFVSYARGIPAALIRTLTDLLPGVDHQDLLDDVEATIGAEIELMLKDFDRIFDRILDTPKHGLMV